ncbi:MAG: DUF2470 domain-containing protein [Pseudomonadota bacterium]
MDTEETLSTAAKSRIIEHMNDDHADACLDYVHHFAERKDATQAMLIDVTPGYMELNIDTPNGEDTVRITFKEPLTCAEDAHHAMVDMARQARCG